MTLNEDQKKQVIQWINAGAKLAEIQGRLEKEFGARVTYMEVRFLVDDLKVMPKDPEEKKAATPPAKPAARPPDCAQSRGGVRARDSHSGGSGARTDVARWRGRRDGHGGQRRAPRRDDQWQRDLQ